MHLNRYTLIIAALISANIAAAQGLTQSADGKSTIPIRGTAVGLDLGETELSFGYNNIDRVVRLQKITPVFGADVKVKNEEGVGSLFSAGDIVGSGKANFFGGITFSNAFSSAASRELAIRERVEARMAHRIAARRAMLRDQFTKVIALESRTVPAAISSRFIRDMSRAIPATNTEEFYDVLENMENTIDPGMREAYEAVKAFAKKRNEEFIAEKENHINRLADLNSEFLTKNYNRFTFFGFGGINAISFKKFNGVDSSNLSGSFTNIDDRGGNIGIGANYQIGCVWIGATYSYEMTNNFSELKKKEYTLTSTTTVNNQTLKDEAKITGYSGTYGNVEINNFNADVVFRIRLDEENVSHMLLNPYLRATMFSRNTSLLVDKANLGLGMYFTQKKFLGGIYVELPDVNNEQEKMKPTEEQNLRPPFKRLSFGVVTKINLSTIMGW